MKSSHWREEIEFTPDPDNPMGIVRNVAFEMEKRGLSTILEIGCGQGRNAAWLAEKGFSVTGVDLIMKDLVLFREYAKKRGINPYIIQNDISHLSFKENQFDVVMSFHVLTFVPEHARPLVLQEVRRVLRPHGIFVAVERSQKDPDYKKGVEIERETYTFQGYTHHFFSGEELRELLSPMDVAVLRDMRIIDASHGSLHVHGVWTAVAVNK
ncbi:MAG: class I SAM-dependent methyltransferase [Theionarchaea archaeon]|nr:MAG: hypothetical protein AYK19_10645 [Theionarchaea archaeon DG-70-1]MBU7027321.1 class I SAM-dependent methyltransferase [Theionarchaea archaeon]